MNTHLTAAAEWMLNSGLSECHAKQRNSFVWHRHECLGYKLRRINVHVTHDIKLNDGCLQTCSCLCFIDWAGLDLFEMFSLYTRALRVRFGPRNLVPSLSPDLQNGTVCRMTFG